MLIQDEGSLPSFDICKYTYSIWMELIECNSKRWCFNQIIFCMFFIYCSSTHFFFQVNSLVKHRNNEKMPSQPQDKSKVSASLLLFFTLSLRTHFNSLFELDLLHLSVKISDSIFVPPDKYSVKMECDLCWLSNEWFNGANRHTFFCVRF